MPGKTPHPLSVLIAEDDRMARADLRAMIEKLPAVGEIHEATSVDSSLVAMAKCKVLFVDIILGRESGLTIAEQADRTTQSVIFTTAHKDYAHRAFELNATDYLLKPIDASRLHEAWMRAVEKLLKTDAESITPRFTLRSQSGVEFLPVTTLISVHAEGNYLRLYLFGRAPVIIRETFENWMNNFPAGHLIEAGRGRAVNRQHIRSISGPHNERIATLCDNRQVSVSRRRAADFEKEALGRSLGTEEP